MRCSQWKYIALFVQKSIEQYGKYVVKSYVTSMALYTLSYN